MDVGRDVVVIRVCARQFQNGVTEAAADFQSSRGGAAERGVKVERVGVGGEVEVRMVDQRLALVRRQPTAARVVTADLLGHGRQATAGGFVTVRPLSGLSVT